MMSFVGFEVVELEADEFAHLCDLSELSPDKLEDVRSAIDWMIEAVAWVVVLERQARRVDRVRRVVSSVRLRKERGRQQHFSAIG